MQKITYFLLLIVFQLSSLSAQTYFNEWIDYDETYYQFTIEENGIYRIPYEALLEVGLEGKVASGFHLFTRGKEIPISTSNTSSLSEGDYIEFYGAQNDGSFDSQLFTFSNDQLTSEQSLFTKRASYYLMWDKSFAGLRYKKAQNDLSAPLPEQEAYFMHTERRINRNVFWFGEPTRIAGIGYNYPDFEKGEGWTGSSFSADFTKEYSLNTIGVYNETGTPSAVLETKVLGQGNDFFAFNDHHLNVKIGENIYVDEEYEGYDIQTYTATIDLQGLQSPQTTITYEAVGDLATDPVKDKQSAAYTFLTYPRQFDFGKYFSGEIIPSNRFAFEFQDSDEKYFEVSNFGGSETAVLHDLTHGLRILVAESEGLYPIHLPNAANSGSTRELFLAEEADIPTIEALEEKHFTDFQLAENQGDYILIYHSLLTEGETNWVEAYANYRASEAGGSHDVMLVDIEELYDQFAHGIQTHPLSIRHFVNFAVDKWTLSPKLLFLMGKSIGYRSTTTPSSFEENLIPTYGHNPSDNYLTIRNNFDYRPQLGVGRLSAKNPLHVRDYLNKVQEYEALGEATRLNRSWRKHALFQKASDLSDLNEESILNQAAFFENPLIGGKILDIQAYETYSENFQTRPFLKAGIGLLTFGGESTGEVWKTNIAKNPSVYNQEGGRYPMILSFSAFTTNIHKSTSSPPSMAEEWVLSDNHGAIGYWGGSWFFLQSVFSNVNGYTQFADELIKQLGTDGYDLTFGEVMKEILSTIYVDNSPIDSHEEIKAIIGDVAYQGDPAIRLASSFDRPEYIIENGYEYNYIDKGGVLYEVKTENRDDVLLFDKTSAEQIHSINGVYGVKNVDDLQLQLRVGNLGKAIEGEFEIEISKQDVNGENAVVLTTIPSNAPLYETMLQLEVSLVGIEEVEYQLVVKVDANDDYEEDSETNNVVVLEMRSNIISDISTPPMLENIQVFPNPFQSQLQIGGDLSANTILQLFDIQGKLVFSKQLEGQGLVNVETKLAKGMYLLKIKDDEGIWMQKMMKE